MKRLGWALVLVMDTPFVMYHARRVIGVSWRVIIPFWWKTSRAMWQYGE